jgi:pyruvate/2-oxoacid:ferredoxin oxidoreductase alpha subunit
MARILLDGHLSAMAKSRAITVDGNESAASVAHRVSDVIAIYPITPSSAMGELSDEWSNYGRATWVGAARESTCDSHSRRAP